MGGPALIDGTYHQETNNFKPCYFKVADLVYSSPENYFQAAKAANPEDREYIRTEGKTGLNSWSLGGTIKMRSDWEEVKVEEMYTGNRACFDQYEDQVKDLINTKGPIKFHGSTPFWNFWNGKIMERLRAEFRNTEEDQKIAQEIRELMDKYMQNPLTFGKY